VRWILSDPRRQLDARGLLYALQIARRRHGPNARCTKLDLDGPLQVDGATFEAVVGTSIGTEAYRFTVLVDRRDALVL
jgi:hypothetical protein